jgi:hypothetical protein
LFVFEHAECVEKKKNELCKTGAYLFLVKGRGTIHLEVYQCMVPLKAGKQAEGNMTLSADILALMSPLLSAGAHGAVWLERLAVRESLWVHTRVMITHHKSVWWIWCLPASPV